MPAYKPEVNKLVRMFVEERTVIGVYRLAVKAHKRCLILS